jgi:hypothetical protein
MAAKLAALVSSGQRRSATSMPRRAASPRIWPSRSDFNSS